MISRYLYPQYNKKKKTIVLKTISPIQKEFENLSFCKLTQAKTSHIQGILQEKLKSPFKENPFVK